MSSGMVTIQLTNKEYSILKNIFEDVNTCYQISGEPMLANPIGAITATYTEVDSYRPPRKESDLWRIHGTPEKSGSSDETCLQFIYMNNGNRFNGVGNFDGVYFKDLANNGELIAADDVLCWRYLTWPK